MKKIILVVLSLIIFLSGCTQKPMTEEEKIKAVNEIFFKGIDTKLEAAAQTLKEAEEAIGTTEIKGIWVLDVYFRGISDTVCFEALDGTKYFAQYSYHTISEPSLRLVRKDYYDGEIIWKRAAKESSIKILEYNKKFCYIRLDNWDGRLEYDKAFRLEKLNNKEWEQVADVEGNTQAEIEEGARKLLLTWQFVCGSLEEGTYKLIFPVVSYMTDNDGNEYEKNIELSAEFKIN
jgi:5-hydroxyisourate hydrolase-like protein (transthyretin family)